MAASGDSLSALYNAADFEEAFQIIDLTEGHGQENERFET